ncbi:alpha/beta fold hydrolase [Rhodococcus sp. TAF43]|uniref:alpha/beta fold hydrolase n=1 Tax=unclassified Rhodococcus (in: high G+C Gram-positive bacteria) TaxID=192944 RepID=UPI0015837425|nr:alpha/beta hydrolase [Rhodococcus sp. W8901]QKT13433.1 alpha/beta hydrolase [Rhodococcus sp. W8901]
MTTKRSTDADHGRRHIVQSEDGVALAVREYGPSDAPVTAVFVHGHCLHSHSWARLRSHLVREWGPSVRMVFYDHRGHGASGSAPAHTYTIDQLGRDLDAVIRATVPTGPVVLVGHSMGGMAALAYTRQNPAAVGSRVVGVGLLSTAASGITRSGLGRFLRHPVMSLFQFGVERMPRLMQRVLTHTLDNQTSVVTMYGFLRSFVGLDESGSLAALRTIPSLVLGGTADLLTPFEHSVAIAADLPSAELVRLHDAGHSVILDQAADVAHAVVRLVARASDHYAAAPSTTPLSAVV